MIVDDDPEMGIGKITDRLAADGMHVAGAHEEPFSLEDVFIAVVEKMRKEGKAAGE